MEKNRIWCTRLLELSEDISSPGDGVQYGDGERPRLMRRKEAVGDSPRVLLRVTAHLELANNLGGVQATSKRTPAIGGPELDHVLDLRKVYRAQRCFVHGGRHPHGP